jgi:hypothetical protein
VASSSGSESSTSTGSATVFPTTPVLDNFNRDDGALGNGWLIGTPSEFAVSDEQMSTGSDDAGVILWPTQFGTTQEAFITFEQVDPSDHEIELILKSQGGFTECGSLLADYQQGVLNAFACTPGTTQISPLGTGIAMQLTVGDQLGARALPSGILEIYKNGQLKGTFDASAWPYAKLGGQIGFAAFGLSHSGKYSGWFDDFGGG